MNGIMGLSVWYFLRLRNGWTSSAVARKPSNFARINRSLTTNSWRVLNDATVGICLFDSFLYISHQVGPDFNSSFYNTGILYPSGAAKLQPKDTGLCDLPKVWSRIWWVFEEVQIAWRRLPKFQGIPVEKAPWTCRLQLPSWRIPVRSGSFFFLSSSSSPKNLTSWELPADRSE